MDRLLVTGIDGTLGCNFALSLSDRWQVLGIYAQHAIESDRFASAPWDAANLAAVHELIRDWQPAWIIHCSTLSAGSWETAVESAHEEREPALVAQLAESAAAVKARLAVISSDVVFGGPRMFHEETYPAGNPARRAGLVRRMEQALADTAALVVRTHAYGWSPVPEGAGFAQRAFEALTSGDAFAADGGRHATPILATDLAELFTRAYERGLQGLYHIGGSERSSPFRFVSELAAALDVRHHGGLPAAGSLDDEHAETSLNSKRARRELEMATPMLRDGLERFVAQARNGWRNACHLAGSNITAHVMAA